MTSGKPTSDYGTMRAIRAAGGGFFVTGGTMRPGAPSYVERTADRDLLEALQAGEFCYVLDTRQMGKSSLMASVARKLRRARCSVVIIDLTAIGQNLMLDQWYDAQVDTIARQLDVEDDVLEFREQHENLGPLEKLVRTIREVVLEKIEGRIVVFVDEIDFVRSLPFSTDEFFAGIRQFYNSRANDSAFDRLTFCLLGVSTPNELIRAEEVTPFNLGRRIDIQDFSLADAEKTLLSGLHPDPETARRLLERIFYWTDGHPYLTQRLCDAVAASAGRTGEDVDRVSEELFLSPGAREQNDNLRFVANRLLVPGMEADTLAIYAKLLRDEPVPEKNPFAEVLRLSGIAKAVDGRFRVRNQIYRRVFDHVWIEENMPDRERRLIEEVARRTRRRTLYYTAIVIAAIGAFGTAGYNMYQSHVWKSHLEAETKLRRDAEDSATKLKKATDDASAQRDLALEKGNLAARSAEQARLALLKETLAEKQLEGANRQMTAETDRAKKAEAAATESASKTAGALKDSRQNLDDAIAAKAEMENLNKQLTAANKELRTAQTAASTLQLAVIADMLRQAQPRSIELSALLAVQAAGKAASAETYQSLRNVANLLPHYGTQRDLAATGSISDRATSPNQRYMALQFQQEVCAVDLKGSRPPVCAKASGVDQLIVTDAGVVMYTTTDSAFKADLFNGPPQFEPLKANFINKEANPVLHAGGCLAAARTTPADRVLITDTCKGQSYTLRRDKAHIHAPVAFDAEGRYLLTAWTSGPITAGRSASESLGMWQLDTRKLIDTRDGWEACTGDQFSADLKLHYCLSGTGEKVETLKKSPLDHTREALVFPERSSSFAFSPDSRSFARATRAGVLLYRDQALKTSLQASESAESVEFNASSDLVAVKTSSNSQTLIRVFDLNGIEQERLSSPADVFFAGSDMAQVGSDHKLRLFPSRAGLNTPAGIGAVPAGGIFRVTPDGRYLVTGATRSLGHTQFSTTGAGAALIADVVQTLSGVPEAISADGSTLIAGDNQQGHTVLASLPWRTLRRMSSDGQLLAISRDGSTAAFSTRNCPGIAQRANTCVVLESTGKGNQQTVLVTPAIAAFSTGGDLLHTVSTDGQAQTWRVADGNQVSKMPLGTFQIPIADPQGNAIVGRSGPSETSVWDLKSNSVRKLPFALSTGASLSEDGRFLATTTGSGTDFGVSVFRVADGGRISNTKIPVTFGRTLRFNHAGTILLVSMPNQLIVVRTGAGLPEVLEPKPAVTSLLGFTADDSQFGVLLPAGKVVWYRSDTLAEAGTTQLLDPALPPRISPDGRWMITGSTSAGTGAVPLLFSLSPSVLLTLTGQSLPVPTAVAIGTGSPPMLASAGTDGVIRVISARQSPSKPVNIAYSGIVTSLAFSSDEKLLAVGGENGLALFNASDGNLVASQAQAQVSSARAIAFPREDSLLVLTARGVLRSVLPSLQTQRDLVPGEIASAIAISPDNRIAAAVGPDSLRTWNTSNWTEGLKSDLKGLSDPKFSSSGRLLAARLGANGLHVWSTGTGKPVAQIQVSYDIVSYAFSDDESVLGVASTGTVELWPLELGAKRPVGAIPTGQSIAAIAFVPGGDLLVGVRAGNSFLTPWRRPDLITRVCDAISRKTALSAPEQTTYGLTGNYVDYCADPTQIAKN